MDLQEQQWPTADVGVSPSTAASRLLQGLHSVPGLSSRMSGLGVVVVVRPASAYSVTCFVLPHSPSGNRVGPTVGRGV